MNGRTTGAALQRAWKLKVQDGPAPQRAAKGEIRPLVLTMRRGSWILVTRRRARSVQDAIRELGGSSTMYPVDSGEYCVKVLEAPWREGGA